MAEGTAFKSLYADQCSRVEDLKKLSENFGKDGPARYTVVYLNKRLTAVQDAWSQIRNNHDQLMKSSAFAGTEYAQKNYIQGVKSLYLGTLAKMQPWLNEVAEFAERENLREKTASETEALKNWPEPKEKEKGDGEVESDLGGSGSSSEEEEVQVNHLQIKLPKMEIPKFGGDIRKWRNFYDMFKKLIDEQKELSDIERFTYLRTYLTGEPLALISHLDVSAATYGVALQTLVSRYNNKRTLIDAEVDMLLAIGMKGKGSESLLVRALHDQTREALYNLKSLGVDTTNWDAILTRLTMKKMDQKSINSFEDQLEDTREVPKVEQLLTFLERRFHKLDQMNAMNGASSSYSSVESKDSKIRVHTATKGKISCFFCNGEHWLQRCERFLRLPVNERWSFIKGKNLCFNCMSHDKSKSCTSKGRCKVCNKPHHHLLHFENSRGEKIQGHHSALSSISVLPTALVLAVGRGGMLLKLRALIDSGSQASFITTQAAQELNAWIRKSDVKISGVGVTSPLKATKVAEIQLESPFNVDFKLKLDAILLPKLTSLLPRVPKEIIPNWVSQEVPSPLADPNDNSENAKIDLILGTDCLPSIMTAGLIKSSDGFLAQSTVFGWIIQGGRTKANRISVNTVTRLEELWELPNESQDETKEEIEFEFTRARDGKFSVSLPFKGEDFQLNNNRNQAVARFLAVERNLERNPQLKAKYQTFMREYLEMGHMTLADKSSTEPEYFIPHHGICRDNSLTTKLRVVFDASARTNNLSLNDVLHAGPLLLNSLWQILIRFRIHKIVFVADIEKMYRQIWVKKEHCNFQKIFWRFDKRDELKEYQLLTVTYGVISAPFLAMSCLRRIASENAVNYPESCLMIERDCYMDDIITGSATIEEAKLRVKEISSLLRNSGFPLKKFASNAEEALMEVAESDKVSSLLELKHGEDAEIKTLGIGWKFEKDTFEVQLGKWEIPKKVTMRILLSFAAQAFDPMGWYSAVLVRTKLLVQSCWKAKLDWDAEVPEDIYKNFLNLRTDIQGLKGIEIPRDCFFEASYQLLGFSDASGHQAHGAMVYIKVGPKVTLLATKSRVNPMKPEVKLPRLELMGAVVLAELVDAIKKALPNPPESCHLFTDSEIVLGWIRNPALQFKVFVGPRVKKILEFTNRSDWQHVAGKENPADLISRGVSTAIFLKRFNFWWYGPEWTLGSIENFPKTHSVEVEANPLFIEELEPPTISVLTTFVDEMGETFKRFSEWVTLVRVIAFCLRFLKGSSFPYLTIPEIEHAEIAICRSIQMSSISEYHRVQEGKSIEKGPLKALNPFMDENQVLRVGGRLKNSQLSFQQKFPIILPRDHHVTRLLINYAHKITLHGGNGEVLAFLRRQFWIVGGKDAVKKELFKCMQCFRFKAKPMNQLMGDLPEARVCPSTPFFNTGIDFAGPISIKLSSLRRAPTAKAYLCLFVCLATKAIHLEVVSDMTTRAFMAALKRFFSRRGVSRNIYSDNAKTFLCAQTRIIEQRKEIIKFFNNINHELSDLHVQWHFIPPYSPNFGGLWEAGVKSTKYHLKRMAANQIFTFEELTTLLCQIEAVLNSRPLCPLSNDPQDFEVLTPGHFLIGRPLIALPEQHEERVRLELVDRFKRCQILLHRFWSWWSQEYLSRLQQRPRWASRHENLTPNDLVLVHEDFLPPTQWKTARIKEVHPGKDGQVRVVTLTDGKKEFKRNVRKLSKLPVEQPSETEISIIASPASDAISIAPAQFPTTSIQANPQPRRSARVANRKLGLNYLMISVIACLLSVSNAAPKFTEIKREGVFIHHRTTTYFNQGKTSFVLTDEIGLNDIINSMTFAKGNLTHACESLPESLGNSRYLCSSYQEDLEVYWDQYESRLDDVKSRVKRGRGIFGHILHSLKIFFLGSNEYDELQNTEDEHFHKTGEILGNIVTNDVKLRQQLSTRNQAVQRQLEKIVTEINDAGIFSSINEVKVIVYLNQLFAAAVQVIEHAISVLGQNRQWSSETHAEIDALIQPLIPSKGLLSMDDFKGLGNLTLVEVEPFTYVWTFPLLASPMEAISVFAIPNLNQRTIPIIDHPKLFISDKQEFVIDQQLGKTMINDQMEIVWEPTIVHKVMNDTKCYIQQVMGLDRECLLDKGGLKTIDELSPLTNGQVLIISEKFNQYHVQCDNFSMPIPFAMCIVEPGECQITTVDKYLQSQSTHLVRGHGHSFHIPHHAFQPLPDMKAIEWNPLADTEYDMHESLLKELEQTFKVVAKDRSVSWWFVIMVVLIVIILVLGIVGYFSGNYLIRLLAPSLPNLGL